MGIDVIYLKFPESVKNKFINWVKSLNFNPYNQKYYYPISSYKNAMSEKAGNILKQLYPSLDSSLKNFLNSMKNILIMHILSRNLI
ncbi:hypothetical protein HYW87_02780 [Candidatus Roizmanbacteria bacterium]|nr:hypothetical protein [Candidatus Roizmanbacteria bacterium]